MSSEQFIQDPEKSQHQKEGFISVDSIEFKEIRRGSEFWVTIANSSRPDAQKTPVHIKVRGVTKKGLRVEVEGFSRRPFSAYMPGTLRGMPDDYWDKHTEPPQFPTGIDPGRMEIANPVIANKLTFKTLKDLETGEYGGPSSTSGPIVEMFFKR